MKIKEVRELETKDLAERLEAEIAKYNQMNNNGPDGNKKFKKNKNGCRYQQQDG